MANSDPDVYRAYMRGYMKRRWHYRRKAAVAFLGGKCSCGATRGLVFDHIDFRTKRFTLAKRPSVNEVDFWIEVAKCQLLCPRCNRNKTRIDISTIKKAWWKRRKKGRKC